jgi:hypothetical protein
VTKTGEKKDDFKLSYGLSFRKNSSPFGLPLFAGAAGLASLGCAIKAVWLRLTGNDPLFVPSLNELDHDRVWPLVCTSTA